ncbi:iron-siderophore ABC transporter substrate-binding protein, partial [Streptomyces sp. SID8455]|nr:iron-siderophore ABC transporter substrate-binding protein [Streptomyces sp. SID8455]
MNPSVSRRPRRTPVLMAGAVAVLLVGVSACGSSDDSS